MLEKNRIKVLIIEDSKPVQLILKELLKRSGFDKISEAGTGEEGIEYFKKNNPLLVMLDLSLPKMHGFDCLQEILNMNPEAKVIVSSSIADEKSLSKAKELGAIDFFIKPFDKDMVINKLKKLKKHFN